MIFSSLAVGNKQCFTSCIPCSLSRGSFPTWGHFFTHLLPSVVCWILKATFWKSLDFSFFCLSLSRVGPSSVAGTQGICWALPGPPPELQLETPKAAGGAVTGVVLFVSLLPGSMFLPLILLLVQCLETDVLYILSSCFGYPGNSITLVTLFYLTGSGRTWDQFLEAVALIQTKTEDLNWEIIKSDICKRFSRTDL